MRRIALLPLLILFACRSSDSERLMVVEVRTDYVAGVEFDRIEILVEGNDTNSVEVAYQDSVRSALRAGEFLLDAGTYRVEVRLFEENTIAGRAYVSVLLDPQDEDDVTVVTVPIQRRCGSVACDESLTCFRGECVAPECAVEDPPASCDITAECMVPSDCEAPAQACLEAACSNGTCFDQQTRECGPGQACLPEMGCVPVECDESSFGQMATTCGVGACARTGTQMCVAGQVVDSCEPAMPAERDTSCDGVDDDCDGRVDEGLAKDTFFSDGDNDGFGINEIEVCQGQGAPEGYTARGGDCNDMDPAIYPGAADNTCDGVDNDCDGRTDEGFRGDSTTCGEGACGGTGMIVCVEGELQDTCETGMPASRDQTCNGRDEDCDGRVDEDFTSQSTSCGVGECAATGMNVCMGGMERNTCMPEDPSPDGCDGLDNDCDTQVDEGFSSVNTTCGMGACASTGMTQCTNGMEENTCEPGMPAERDANCDDIDDDCDGRVDEDNLPCP